MKSELNFAIKKREQAALVAELLAEWISTPKDTTDPKDLKVLNKLLWEASLWLPAEETKALNSLLAWNSDIKTKEMIIKIRNLIQKDEESKNQVHATDLTSFSTNNAESKEKETVTNLA